MNRLDDYDVKVADGFCLRWQLIKRLNVYIDDLNNLYARLQEFDFDTCDIAVFYAYQKVFFAKLEYFRDLIRLFNELELLSNRVYEKCKREISDMLKAAGGKE